MTSEVFINNIYGKCVEQDPSKGIVNKIFENVFAMGDLVRTELKKVYKNVNKRVEFLNKTLLVEDVAAEFLQQNEICALNAIRDLKKYIFSGTIKGENHLEDEWKKIISERLLSQKSKLGRIEALFGFFYSLHWIRRIRGLELLLEGNTSMRSQEIGALFTSLVVPSQEGLENYYLKLSEIKEEGTTDDGMAMYQTLQGGTVLGVSLSGSIVGTGRSGSVYQGEKKIRVDGPLNKASSYKSGSVAFKAGNNILKEFRNLDRFRKKLSAEESKHVLTLLGNGTVQAKRSPISRSSILYDETPITQYHLQGDLDHLTPVEKETLAKGWMGALLRLQELHILTLKSTFSALMYKKNEKGVFPYYRDINALFDMEKLRSDHTIPLDPFFQVLLEDKGVHTPTNEYNEIASCIYKLQQRLPTLSVEERQNHLSHIESLHSQMSCFILGRVLYHFFTGVYPFPKTGGFIVPNYDPIRLVQKKDRLLQAGCSEPTAEAILQLLSFKKPEALPREERVVLSRCGPMAGIFFDYYEGNLNYHFCHMRTSRQQKEEMAKSLVGSISVHLEQDEVLFDMRSYNVLFKIHGSEGSKAVLSDYEALYDFNELIESKNLQMLKAFVKDYYEWTPDDTLWSDYFAILEKLEKIQLEQDPFSEENIVQLRQIKKDIDNTQKFTIGILLCKLFTDDVPFKKKGIKEMTTHPNYHHSGKSSYVLEGNSYEDYKKILKSKCSYGTYKLLYRMIHPQASMRPSLSEIGAYIHS